MRILAIRGENLASLAEPFALEFEQEPLRSAGLFAITGETGAGKSTILDALCLALYDEFPRVVAPGARDEMPDPSGASVRENDPRTILRRGAGRGFAEADFIARDGGRYRARCDLARARGKGVGKLQQRARALWRIDESGEKIEAVESGVEPVNRRIVELTDLTFDQFRRTALLAQGDFDAFLRADAKERADLLEKITGAEIYGILSRRAFERWGEARNALARLEERSKEIGVTPAEERVALDAEIMEIARQRAALSTEQDEMRAALARIDAIEMARDRLAQAVAASEAQEQGWSALAGERQILADLSRAEPLRAPRDAMRRDDRAYLDRRDAAARAREKAEAARLAMDEAKGRAELAAEALAAAEADMARLSPLWDEAAALDARIAAQAQEAERARAFEAAAREHLGGKQKALAATIAERDAAAMARDSARAALDNLGSAQPLSERWREIDDWLAKRAQFVKEKHEATLALQDALKDEKRAEDSRAAFDAADKADRDALSLISAQMREREAAFAALDAAASSSRLEELAQAHELLKAMAGCVASHEAAQEKAACASADIAHFEAEAGALATELGTRRASRDALAARREETERLAELAEAAADPHALRLRAALEESAPCPVCGAREHPFAHSGGAARELVETLRAKRDAARRALAETDKDIADIAASEAKAHALKDAAAQRLEEARAALAIAARDYAAHLAQAPGAGAPLEIAGAAAPIAALLQKTAQERASLQKIASTALDLQRELDRLRKRVDEKREALEARGAARAEAEGLMRAAGEARARYEEKLASAHERIASLDRSLSAFLPLCDLTPADLDRDAAGARRRLEEAGARHRGALEAMARAESRLAELAPRIAALSAETEAAMEREKTAADDHAARAADLAGLRERRAGMLDGEETATHRGRHEEKRMGARRAHEAARAATAEADKMRAACEEGSAAALREAEAALRSSETARIAFADILSASGFLEERAAELLAIPVNEADAMRRTVENAQAARGAAQAAVEQRRADLREAEAKGTPETPRYLLDARAGELAQALDSLAGRLGALQERLARDDDARERAAALAAEIEAARATRKVWDEINAAIGSKEGDKFRRFAQSVTLEQLVALANQRLALLSPRYRLERAGEMGSLGLQIVDRDLGDERRSTRSLSGGERFLASLALALALAGLEGRDSFVDTLFIDEGFGALDSATLDVAIDALENLQGQGRKVGVISHVESMQARIATKICVERRGGGVSRVRLRAPGLQFS
ncbi:AAA family ATPase [Methylocystis sp. JAN1]|uniref:AAA family ATPase n=1 Tax=Methylocystis sp. JAN1 TaxID=3397211 RepID=UPI003FA2F407